jgi:cell division septation protein DedD
VSDLSHDAAEDGFHEIQLSGKQIVFLFMVLTVASAVIFLLGVLVGRDLRSERVDAAGNAPITASNPTTEPAADSGKPAAEPPSPPTETPDELSYVKRLEGEKPAAESVKPEPTPPPAAKPDPPPATRDAGTSGRPGAWIVQVGAFGNAGAARDVVKQLAAKGHPAFLVNPASGMPVIYRVQVGAYDNRSEADQVARRIEKEDQFKPVVRQNR